MLNLLLPVIGELISRVFVGNKPTHLPKLLPPPDDFDIDDD